jgi:hypothetical protein
MESLSMPPADDEKSILPRSGQYFATTGPTKGLILGWDDWPTLGVVDATGSVRRIGTAQATGWVQYRKAPVATFQLVINETKLPGQWVCLAQRFVPLVEAAGEL